MIGIRKGDTVDLTVENPSSNVAHHSIDLQAVYGPGGGASATHLHTPGEETAISFRAKFPGALLHHCAVEDMAERVSSGMFGTIVVEPADGIPPVDRELYLGKHELYTTRPIGTDGHHAFDREAMFDETATYVVFNGENYGFTEAEHAYGPLEAARGERIRVFFANGGPNYARSRHPIGNVRPAAYPTGALADAPTTAGPRPPPRVRFARPRRRSRRCLERRWNTFGRTHFTSLFPLPPA